MGVYMQYTPYFQVEFYSVPFMLEYSGVRVLCILISICK